MRIGHRPPRVLVNLGSIGNYTDAWECTGRGLKMEVEDQAEELKIENESVVKMGGLGLVQIQMWWVHRYNFHLGVP